MHALLVSVTIEPGHDEEAQAQLETVVLPRVREAPGVIAGYWTRATDGAHGASMVIFESEESARAGGEQAQNMPRPAFITFDSIEVREIVAHL
jgi:heme-degrading monooxygenase HmoA